MFRYVYMFGSIMLYHVLSIFTCHTPSVSAASHLQVANGVLQVPFGASCALARIIRRNGNGNPLPKWPELIYLS